MSFVSDLISQGSVSLEDAEVLVSETVRSSGQRLLEMCVSQESSKKMSEPGIRYVAFRNEVGRTGAQRDIGLAMLV